MMQLCRLSKYLQTFKKRNISEIVKILNSTNLYDERII